MAKSKKEKKADCPPCPDCSEQAANATKAPSVKDVRGGFKPYKRETASEKKFSFPGFGYYRKTPKRPCMLDVGKTLQTGRTELDIITNEESRITRIRAGPVLRLCVEGNEPAPTIPVVTPYDAQEISEKFRECNVTGKKSRQQCAVDTIEYFRPGKPVWVTGGEVRAQRKAAVESRKEAAAVKKTERAALRAERKAASEAKKAAKEARKAARAAKASE